MDTRVLVAAVLAACFGALVVASYVTLYCYVYRWRGGKWWWYPFRAEWVPYWVAYTTTTVTAYGAVVYWMITYAADWHIWAALAAFNLSAAAWVPCGVYDATRKKTPAVWLSGLSVGATAVLSVVWMILANVQHAPGIYNIAFVAIVVHHVIVDGIMWATYRAVYPPPFPAKRPAAAAADADW